jgi:glucokinase
MSTATPSVTPTLRLLGDIGGTNARFALQQGPGAPLESLRTLPCAEHATLEAAMRAYLAEVGGAQPVDCAFGIANPVTGDRIRMTNHHWGFSISELKASMGFSRLVVVNDFTALALAVPLLPASSLRAVGGGVAAPLGPIGLLGPGTGLGVSGLLPMGSSGIYLPVAGEGGHVTLAAETDEEFAVLQRVRARYGHCSAERIVSGIGMADLYNALRDARGEAPENAPLQPADITRRALEGGEVIARDALNLFCGFLGSVAGNLALTLGTRGGVYIGGGIVPRLGSFFDASPFRARFEAKGRFHDYLAGIPTWVIDAPTSPALEGAAQAFELPS